MINPTLNARLRTMAIVAALLLVGIAGVATSPASAQSGVVPVHDPSMIKAGNCYYVYSTGGTMSIQKLCEPDGSWTNVGSVFRGIPGWIYTVIGHVPPDLWAPDINYFNGKYYLYYAGSTFGSNQSVIGLVTATDPAGPWTDEGEVLHSVHSDNFNAIDPSLAWDSDGKAWLSFGSFWDGIKMRQIDPATGKLLASNPTLYSLATRFGGAIEASSILHAGDYYYLFVSFDRCCAGVDSTYRIMVGRATSITGPYVAKDGVPMLSGGATELLSTSGPFIGPGGQDVFTDGDVNRLAYHYYDGKDSGKSKLAVREINIGSDGWPTLGPISNLTMQMPLTQAATSAPTQSVTDTATAAATDTAASAATFKNPLNTMNGSDPWMMTYNGNYYLTTTSWTDIKIKKASTINGLIDADPVEVWHDTDPSRCCNMWAPEFIQIGGTWVLYYVAGVAANTNSQHIWVLQGSGSDPMGPYTFKGQLTDSTGGWMIDPDIFQLNGKLYVLFSAFAGQDQSLWIAPMSDPWTISGSRVRISSPSLSWERQVAPVNEGPEMLQHDGKTFVVYSASACWGPAYELGLLTLTGSDPLDIKSWAKTPTPIFTSANGAFGPGHNGFFKSKDGKEDWIVYHASDSARVACDGTRTTRIQKITWNADGTPNLGSPLSLSTSIAVPSGD